MACLSMQHDMVKLDMQTAGTIYRILRQLQFLASAGYAGSFLSESSWLLIKQANFVKVIACVPDWTYTGTKLDISDGTKLDFNNTELGVVPNWILPDWN